MSARRSPGPADLVTTFRHHADADPERMSLTWLAGLTDPVAEVTVGALDDAAAAVAAALLAHAEPGERVLLVQPPGLDFVTGFLGCLYAGCVPVPVYPLLDSEENTAKIRRVLADSGAVLAWTCGPDLAEHIGHALAVRACWAVGTDRYRPGCEPAPRTVAFLQYTSGSTADPRGVVVTHGNLAANLNTIRDAFQQDQESVVLSWLPAYHDMGLIGNILHPLYTGCRAYLGSPIDFIRNPLSWLDSIDRYAVTASGAPNFAYDLIVKAASREPLPALSLGTWRTAYCGAEPVSQRTLTRFADLLAPSGFRREAFMPCYGLAEATLLVAAGSGVTTRRSPEGQHVVSCGIPRDCALVVADTEGRPQPDGEVGEILVQGPSVAAGYFRRPDDSRTAFGSRVANRAGTWLRTGDLGFVDGGELFVTGRIKDVINVRGRNHYPQDLESLVAETCTAIRAGCTAAFASPAGDAVVIVAELRPGHELTAADRLTLNAVIASAFGLAVHEFVTVPKGTVPKTTSGKLRRAECQARYLAGDYDQHRADVASPARAADADVLRDVVADVLDGWVADDEPLAARGLDSLRATRLAELLMRRAGVDVPVRVLLGATLTDLSRFAVGQTDNGVAAVDQDATTTGRLSKAQESLLFLHMLDPASDAYTISFAWEPAPDSDFDSFEAAVRTALSWYPQLATRITADEHRGWRIAPMGQRALRDVLALNPIPIAEDRLEEQLGAAAALPFDLFEGPLLRLYRWQTPVRRVYQLVVHHIVTDLWSMCLLLRDIAGCYTAFVADGKPTPPPSVPYGSYVREQETYLASEAARARDEELRALLPTRGRSIGIRTDAPYPARRAGRATRVTAIVEVTPTAVQDPVATMITLWAATLERYGTPVPVVIGVPVSGRAYGRHATVRGLCTNTVPIALDLEDDRPLTLLIASVRDQLDRGMDAALYPLARAVEAVRPERVPGRHPLVETLITVHENPMPDVPGMLAVVSGTETDLVIGRLAMRLLPVPMRACRYDLDLVITPRQGGYLLALDYAAELFSPATAKSILATFQSAMTAAFSGTGTNVGDVMALSSRDEELLARISTNDTGRLEPPALTRIRRIAQTDPDRPAIQTSVGILGYGEFMARADRIAGVAYAAAGPGTSASAALLLTSSADFATAMFGAWLAGLGIFPLPAEYPDERLAYMLADCPPRVLFTCSGLAARARALVLAAGLDITLLDLDELPIGPAMMPPVPTADAPAFTVYTSGSSGVPKGVSIRHDQISPLVAWSEREWELGSWTRIAQTLSLGFDFGLQELFTVLPAGGCVVIPDSEDRCSARAYARFLRKARVTALFITPSYAAELAAAGEQLPDLRLVLFGGEVLRRAVVTGMRALVGRHCRLFNGYGPTEATVNCLMGEVPWDIPDDDLPDVLPVGTATAASRIYLVDGMDRQVPVGAIGEILIGGPGVADGYHNQPELTAQRFQILGLDAGPVYRTGDLAYVRPGSGYVVVGRTDRQVKVKGFRVELGEVEHVLLGAPGVTSAVARIFGDPGEMIAFLVGDQVDAEAVARHAARMLSPAMLPSKLVPLDRLPTTVNGKLDEGALAEAAAAADEPPPLSGTASPAEIERAICEIWASALAVPYVDAGANVFELGAHSLIATRVHSRLQASVGVTFPVPDIFEYPRPRELAQRIVAHRRSYGANGSKAGPTAANKREEQ